MNVETIAMVMAVFFLAAFLKGTTGLGFSTAALPLLTLVIGLKVAIPLVIIPSLASNLAVMAGAGHIGETLRRFWLLFLSALPGVAIGLALLAHVDAGLAAAILGVVMIGYAAYALSLPRLRLAPWLERPLAPAVGLATGTINGLTGSQVMPVLPYLMALDLDPNRFVQAINISFTLSSLVMAAGLVRIGLMTGETALIATAGLLPVLIGVRAGARLRTRLDSEVFRRLVLIVLVGLGVTLVVRALT